MFLMLPLAFGLFAVSIPIVIHLLHRQRTQPVLWAAMQFLRQSQLQLKRRKKVDHWLLMLIRVAAIALLAIMLARPLWIKGSYLHGVAASAPVDVAVVLDHSLSTGRVGNGKTIFDQGVAVTDKILEQLHAGDTFSVVLAEHNPRAINAQPIKKSDQGAINQIKQQLRELKPGATDCSIPVAIRTAHNLVNNGRNFNKIIIVISDHQRSNWHVKDDATWHSAMGDREKDLARTLSIHSYPIAPDADAANVSVGQITLSPSLLGPDRPVQVNASITNDSPKPMSAMAARLIVNGKETSVQQVPALAAGAGSNIRFDLEKGFGSLGSNWVKVSLNAVDALQADNEAVAAATVWQRIPVLVIDGQLTSAGDFRGSRFLQAALTPQDPSVVQPRIISVTEAQSVKLEDFVVTIVNDVPSLPAKLRDRLADYARSGHGLWFILGSKTTRGMIEKDLASGSPELFKATVTDVQTANEKPPGIEVKDPNNPMVALVAASERNALTGAATRKWWSLRPMNTDAQVVLAASSGDPLIIERPYGTNGGIIALWSTSVDGSWNNWNLMPNFVPLVNETLYHLASGQLKGLERRWMSAGESIEWIGPAKPAVQSVDITLPDGTHVTRAATNNNGRWMVTYADTYLPGIYRLQFTPTEIQPVYYGVNIDRKELDPTPLAKDDVEWFRKGNFLDPSYPTIDDSQLATVIRKENKGTEMWGWLGALLLASLLFETYMTYRMIGSQRRVDVANAGLVSAHAA